MLTLIEPELLLESSDGCVSVVDPFVESGLLTAVGVALIGEDLLHLDDFCHEGLSLSLDTLDLVYFFKELDL